MARTRMIRIALAALLLPALLLAVGAAAADRLTPVATFDWSTPSVIGLSGLEVSADGTRFHAVSDRGWILGGRFEREDGTITAVLPDSLLPILGQDGLPAAARRAGDWSDAEGLAMAPDGTLWISFERWARVARHAAPDAPGQWIRDHPDFAGYPDNRQLEAVAIAPDGTIFTFAERPLAAGFAIYRLASDGWTVDGHIPPSEGFAIVGADFGPDGRLYLLERKLRLGLWWQSRIRRLMPQAPEAIETLWTSAPAAYGNLEGIALWMQGDSIRALAVSDNNGVSGAPIQFVEFRLDGDTVTR
jgi:hypothetical protein